MTDRVRKFPGELISDEELLQRQIERGRTISEVTDEAKKLLNGPGDTHLKACAISHQFCRNLEPDLVFKSLKEANTAIEYALATGYKAD